MTLPGTFYIIILCTLRRITHHKIHQLCKENEIDFKNQTLPSFVRSLKDKFCNFRHKRKDFTEGERKAFLRKNPYCSQCCKKLELSMEDTIDKVRRLNKKRKQQIEEYERAGSGCKNPA